MKTTISLILCISFVSAAVLADDFAHDRQQNWHQWRGPNANGVSPHGDPPVEWNEDSNIRWKVEVPGRGSSTPIVWGNQVFLLTAIKTDRVAESLPKLPESSTRGGNPFRIQRPTNFYKFVVLCFDRQTGKIIWQQTSHIPVAYVFDTWILSSDSRACATRPSICLSSLPPVPSLPVYRALFRLNRSSLSPFPSPLFDRI